MNACVIIPARFGSTRFPGKPLVPLMGKPMVLWVAELSALAVGKNHVYIATDDVNIYDVVCSAGFSAVWTNSDALTGTDRVAEAAKQLNYEIYINVQGDEPLVSPKDISRCVELKRRFPEYVINGYTRMSGDEDPENVHIPKVVTSERGELVYMSRQAVPGCKDCGNDASYGYMKQVCIYAFGLQELDHFSRFGRKSILEEREDIEILRFLEIGHRVLMCECSCGSMAVDVPADVARVEREINLRHNPS